jgi:carboxylesterase type B
MGHSIRYAQSPAGKLRRQPPRAPEANKDSLIKADTWPAQCPQSPGASGTYTVADNDESSEDCLFVNARMKFSSNNCARY